MKIIIIISVLFLSCYNLQNVKKFNFRQIIYTQNDSNWLEYYFVLEYNNKELPKYIIDKIDSSICKHIESIKVSKSCVISILKESDETRKLKIINGITDSSNPNSDEHYEYYKYIFNHNNIQYERNFNQLFEKDSCICNNNVKVQNNGKFSK